MIADRIAGSIKDIVRTEIAALLAYSGRYDYTITGVHGDMPNVTIDCKPANDAEGLPDLMGVQMQPDLAGMVTIPDGGQCTVVFLNRDPTRPRITGIPSLGLNPLARLGDEVTCYFPPEIQLSAAVGVPLGPFTGFATLINPNLTGLITVGSARDFSG